MPLAYFLVGPLLSLCIKASGMSQLAFFSFLVFSQFGLVRKQSRMHLVANLPGNFSTNAWMLSQIENLDMLSVRLLRPKEME